MQLQPDILEIRQAFFGHEQRVVDARLVAREELLDDVVLVAEVIVKIAGADPELVRDVVRRDVRLTGRVEHREARVEDALAGLARHARSRAGGRLS